MKENCTFTLMEAGMSYKRCYAMVITKYPLFKNQAKVQIAKYNRSRSIEKYEPKLNSVVFLVNCQKTGGVPGQG